jgi:flavin reductase (DIM6/NTAB) family NADH-FMN oxidoreductase RutF
MLPIPRPYLVARRWAVYDGGDHSIIVGEVIEGEAPQVRCPLIYYKRGYTTIRGC